MIIIMNLHVFICGIIKYASGEILSSEHLITSAQYRAVSFHPVPRAMARVVFLSTKQIDERL